MEAVRYPASLRSINSNNPELAQAIADLAQQLPSWLETQEEADDLMQAINLILDGTTMANPVAGIKDKITDPQIQQLEDILRGLVAGAAEAYYAVPADKRHDPNKPIEDPLIDTVEEVIASPRYQTQTVSRYSKGSALEPLRALVEDLGEAIGG